MTTKLREEFEHQCDLACQTAKFHGIPLDVVLVRHPRSRDSPRISILGNAISRAAYELWRADGSQVRLLRIYDKDGQRAKNAHARTP